MSIKIISYSHGTPALCKCGNRPTVGGRFWYKCKYSDEVIEGVIAELCGSSITSTRGATYPNHEISVQPLDIIREEKLNKLGL